MKILKYVLWIGVIAVAFTIFQFSSQNAKTSDSVSKSITRRIVDTLPSTKNKTENEKAEIVKKINNYIRKTAHFTLFFLLGLFLITAMLISYESKYSVSKIFVMAMIIALIYAVSDEVHQIFVPERGPGVKDVLIDFSGALTAIVLFLTARYTVFKIKRKKQQKRLLIK